MKKVICTLVFPGRRRESDYEILLGLHTRGVSKGRRNGYGGKVETEDQSIRERTVIELDQEGNLRARAEDLIPIARMQFNHMTAIVGLGVPMAREITMYTYLVEVWDGEPQTTDVVADPRWYRTTELPFHEMLPGENLWLPEALARKRIVQGVISFANGEIQSHAISGSHLPPTLF